MEIVRYEIEKRGSLNNNPVEYPELMKLLQLRNTFAVTSAEAERVFSSMNRVKRADRSLLSDVNTENLVLLHHHKDIY